MSHRNARTTFLGRLLIVQRHRQGWPQAHIAKAMGISRKCVKTWLDRHAAEGEAGLHDRSSRPHSSPRRTSAETERQILELRQRERRGPDWLGAQLGVPARTVSRVLARHNAPRLSALDPLTGQVIRASKTTAVRYERNTPGELVHMDVKKIGRIPEGGGWRAHGRAHRDATRDRNARIGFDFVHSLVDDHSRLAYSEILPDEKGGTCAAFLARAIAYFAKHGITRIERLMTDNAWAYRWSLRHVCAEHSIRQKFIKPHCPWQNGKVERYNRTLQTEWAYRQVFTSNTERAAALAPWLEHYNTQRRHNALGGHPPTSRLPPT
ncbi:IS481 family transposase [Amycolatopsis thermalba]|uniref:IS481 family transposase n=2 Tax=Amycolatopsis TaxID=1813 RepID=A0ABY4P210_9PSEU|nr:MULTISPECIES: IS481 family transposase [Amycolatopsis]UQS23738.1 IS481 family transposase [Amycolatopsis thermalba]UQS26392.1 IS481 family transposase [Amycolatopsis thermalba]UQS26440.1 IS481 family transposase [Amycolatopsis thermalba]